MHSPRVPLSPKHSNSASSSPSKPRVESPFVNRVRLSHKTQDSPCGSPSSWSMKSPTRSASPTRKSPRRQSESPSRSTASRSSSRASGPSFTIFEDTKTYRGNTPDLAISGRENRTVSKPVSTEFVDQENALQPKPVAIPQHALTHRRPLGLLSHNEFPGHISIDGNCQKLTQIWHPTNSDNGHRSAHKKLFLPAYITPPRTQTTTKLSQPQKIPGSDPRVSRYLVRTNDVDPELDMEMRLVSKNNRIRKRRLMSVGRNDGRSSLVSKPHIAVFGVAAE